MERERKRERREGANTSKLLSFPCMAQLLLRSACSGSVLVDRNRHHRSKPSPHATPLLSRSLPLEFSTSPPSGVYGGLRSPSDGERERKRERREGADASDFTVDGTAERGCRSLVPRPGASTCVLFLARAWMAQLLLVERVLLSTCSAMHV